MKGSGLLLTVLAILGASLATPQCPPNTGDEDILLPNPADCSSYYKCLNGVAIKMPCPPGLEWSEDLSRCEYPQIANCKVTETVAPTESTPSTPSKPTTPRPDHCPEVDGPEDVLLPNPADCGSFFKCLNGVAHLIRCPPGQEWSVELSRCDYPEIAKCVETETTQSTSPTPSKPSTAKPDHCPEVDGPEDVLLPNPEDCGSFYKCLKGEPHLIPCPAGQEWSIELSRCDYPEIAHCSVSSGTSTSTSSSITSSTSTPVDGCPAENGPEDVLLPNPNDCGSFYKCWNGKPVLMPCPSGQHWSQDLKRCDYPEVVHCIVTQSRKECPAEDGPEDVLLPNPADCNSFFKCLAGVPIIQYCPPGLQWSVEYDRCEYPEIAKCVETETTQSSSSTSSTSPGSTTTRGPPPDHCPAEDGPEDVLLPNPDDCSSFYKCLQGVPHLILCPPGLHWSVELNRCDYPEIAKCEKKTFNEECPLHNDGYDILLPNPDDCSTYFQCSNGEKILRPCPEGTLWNAPMYRCDHAAIAECA